MSVNWILPIQRSFLTSPELRPSPRNDPEGKGTRREPTILDNVSGRRFSCSSRFPIVGTLKKPIELDGRIRFTVRSVSSSGMTLVVDSGTSLRGGRGRFLTSMSLPTGSQVNATVRLCSLVSQESSESDGLVVVEAEFERISTQSRRQIGQYLLTFAPRVSRAELDAEGYCPYSVAAVAEIGVADMSTEYDEILDLRWRAYSKAGKLAHGRTVDQMGDQYDNEAMILVARHHGRIVASVRLVLGREGQDLEHQTFVHNLPGLPPNAQIVEGTKFCVDPNYQRSDIFYRLCQECMVATLKSGRRYFLLNAAMGMIRVYRQLGLRPVGEAFPHPHLADIPHQAMLVDVEGAVFRGGMPIGSWLLLGIDVYDHLVETGVYSPKRIERVRAFLVRTLRPLFTALAERRGFHVRRLSAPSL